MIKSPRKLILSAAIAAAVLSACQQDTSNEGATMAAAEPATQVAADSTAASETERFIAWLDERHEESLQQSPMSLTYLGRKEQYDQINQIGEAATREQLAWRQGTVEDMKANFDYDTLTPAAQESWDLWVFQTERFEDSMEFMFHEYLFGELGGPEDNFPTFLINLHKVDTESDMEAYVTRIGGVARAMGQILVVGKQSAGKGVRPPQFAFETASKRATNVISGQPFNGEEDSPLLADGKRKIEALVEAGEIDEARAEELLKAFTEALTTQLQPSYQAYIDWLGEEIVNADIEPRGASELPNGMAYYDYQLAGYTTLPMSADDVHELGKQEVARIKGEMETIKAQVGYEGPLVEFFEFIRTDEQFYYSNTDEGREGYLADTREFLAEIDKKLPDYFGRLPKAGLEVKRVESFREVDGGAQHYMSGTPDGSRNGVYYVHMSDMSAYSKTDMETVAYHEASPGHHMQVSIAQELTGVPEFRTQARFSVYSEGWALYSEKLAKEMGQFKDPYMDFGRLTAEMWRAIRLVVDTGLHSKGWTQEEAVQYFFDNSAIPEGAVRSEVRRYLTIPGQATSYKIGMLKIEELRARAEETLGDRFDIRGFHDVVLGGGALPMPLLEQRVDRWIAEQQG